jgi:hypothetical protein
MAPSSIFLGESEIENRYFRHFQQTAAMGMDGAWGWYLWNQLMPQNSHHEPFIWHSIIAIGALLKSHEVAYSAGVDPHAAAVPDIAKLHRDFAMVKYDKAIKLMQEVIFTENTNHRQALLGCIFVVCFEMLVGNRRLAVKHAQAGTMILKQRLVLRKGESPLLSPSPITIENEIVEAFRNLDIQIAFLKDRRSAAFNEETINQHYTTIAALPTSFTDLREAQIHLNLVVRRICHFVFASSSVSESTGFAKKYDAEPPEGNSAIASMKTYSTFCTSFKVTETTQTLQNNFATEMANWMHVFAPLFKRVCGKSEAGDVPSTCFYNAAAMMQMQAIATTILIAGVVITNEMEYDKFNLQFQELVDLATAVVELRQRRKKDNAWVGGFWIDIGITPQLFVVVTRCRDPVIRRRAIKLLEGWYAEGSWDPRLIAQIGSFMMDTEEEMAMSIDPAWETNGVIPEMARGVLTLISEHSGEGCELMQCVLRNSGVDGEPVWKEKYIEW